MDGDEGLLSPSRITSCSNNEVLRSASSFCAIISAIRASGCDEPELVNQSWGSLIRSSRRFHFKRSSMRKGVRGYLRGGAAGPCMLRVRRRRECRSQNRRRGKEAVLPEDRLPYKVGG